VPGANDVRYDANADATNFVNMTTACVATTCTSTVDLDGTALHQVAPTVNTSLIAYSTDIVDLATNAITGVSKLVSAP
jgi:hypothetical protein